MFIDPFQERSKSYPFFQVAIIDCNQFKPIVSIFDKCSLRFIGSMSIIYLILNRS